MTDSFWKPNRHVTAGFFLASAAGLSFTAILSIFLGGPSESAGLLGLSGERLALLIGMLIIFTGLTYFGITILRGKSFAFAPSGLGGKPSRSMGFILGATALVFLAAWLMTWTPAERFGEWYYYIVRIYPFIVWLNCVSGVGVLLLLAGHFGVDTRKFTAFLREQRVSFLIAGAAVLVFLINCLAGCLRGGGPGMPEGDLSHGGRGPLLA